MDGSDEITAKGMPGTLVVFMIGQTCLNLEATEVVESRALKSAPSYPAVIPKQKIIRQERRAADGRDVDFLVKAYLPDMVIVEASLDLDDILDSGILEFKRRLLVECRTVLQDFSCEKEFDEEYSVYCISGYSGDPEVYLSLYGDRIAAFLKNEAVPLDEEEVRVTLSTSLKYGKDDITIVDWDGAFIFDAAGDFRSDIELFEIANMQLLKSRILDGELDRRLEKTLHLLGTPKKLPVLRSRDVRHVLREIVEIRTQSILESEAVEHNIKLIGDWYSARLYSLIARKFHLDEWTTDIKEKLQTLEDVYTMAADNFSISYRATIEFVILAGWFVLLLLYIGEYFLAGK
ncbi:MAG: hypothetical protein M0042_10825 [Nitrospiraceae bacterium]|nr:hypothetical protein [Nitrospiraceae bacterium]